MERDRDPWRRIAGLIEMDRRRALDDFHREAFVPAPAKQPLPAPHPARTLLGRPPLLAAAALLLAVGLACFWLLRGGWKRSALAPAASEILAGSFLYREAGRPEPAGPAASPALSVGPGFIAWAEMGWKHTAVEMEGRPAAVDPSAPVERGDPEKVRRAIGRAIRANAFERMLARIQELHAQEA